MLKGLSFTWFVRCWVAWGMCWCPEIGKVDVMALQILQAWHRPPIKVKSFYKKHCFADLVCSPSQVWSNINKINFDWFWTWMPMLTSSWNNFSLAGALQSREMVAVLCPTENKIMQLHRWWRAVPRRKYSAGIGLRNARDTGGVYRLWVGETQCSVKATLLPLCSRTGNQVLSTCSKQVVGHIQFPLFQDTFPDSHGPSLLCNIHLPSLLSALMWVALPERRHSSGADITHLVCYNSSLGTGRQAGTCSGVREQDPHQDPVCDLKSGLSWVVSKDWAAWIQCGGRTCDRGTPWHRRLTQISDMWHRKFSLLK